MIAVGILGFGSFERWRPAAQSFLDRVVATSTGSSDSDGDTIGVSGVHVRLRGLHCDERGTAGGERARQEMVRLVGGAPVSCVLNGEQTYDRQVGWCSVSGADLGAQLIRSGFCARCAGYDSSSDLFGFSTRPGPWRGSVPPYCH